MFRLAGLLLLLALSSSSLVAGATKFLESMLQEHEKQVASIEKDEHRFLRSDGEFGMRCGNYNGCVQGLECIPTIGRKVCLPKQCAQDAFFLEMVEKNNLDTYAQRIATVAGLVEGEDIFNHTTMALGENALNDDGLQYILNRKARKAIVDAVLANPLDLKGFNEALEKCTGGKQSVQGAAGMGGIAFRAAAGFTFFNSFYYIQGSNDTAGSVFTDICLGLGPQLVAWAGAMGGVAFTGARADLLSCSLQYDAGVTVGVGAGFANGYTLPGCVGQLEFYLNVGAGGGGGLAGCFTNELANYG